MEKDYSGKKIFSALQDFEDIRSSLRKQYPSFSFISEKGDIAEAYAIESYDLKKAVTGQTGFDAVSKEGLKISIKCIWAVNKYRAVALSGGSNTTKDAYKKADHLLVIGRTELADNMSIIFNGPLSYIEPYIKNSVNPRIEVRTLLKVNKEVPIKEKIKAIKNGFPEAPPIYYPKDLNQIFSISSNYWQNLTTSWRNSGCRYVEGLKLDHFLDFGISDNQKESILSLNDIELLKSSYKFNELGYDHFTSVFAAYSEIHNRDFPQLLKVSSENVENLGFSYSVVRSYSRDKEIKKYFSYFFNMEHKGPGGRILQRYFTPHDIAIFKKSYEIRGRKHKGAKGGITDKVNYMKAGLKAAKEIGEAPAFTLFYPKIYK